MCTSYTSKSIQTKQAALCAASPLSHGQQTLNMSRYLGFSIRAARPAVSIR